MLKTSGYVRNFIKKSNFCFLKNSGKKLGLIPLFCLLLTLSGCSCLFFWVDRATPLSPFTDIAVPPDMKIDEKNCRVFESDEGRVGLINTSGCIQAELVLKFYQETMIKNGWTKEGEFVNTSSTLLVFKKASRAAAVTVTGGWFITDVEINVSAK